MNWQPFTYLALMFFTLSVPLLRSFEPRIRYYSKWKYLLPAIFIPAIIFLIWDVYFTRENVWSFNHDFVTGIYILNLPLEEWSFFFVVPFATVFVYEVLNYFIKNFYFPRVSKYVTWSLLIIFVALAVTFHDRMYTFLNFSIAALVTSFQLVAKTHRTYLSRFYLAWFVNLVPFFLVNGVLTSLPVVSYNDAGNMGIRIYTIPVEDFFYFYTLFLMNINIYEYLKRRSQPEPATTARKSLS